MRGDQLTRVLKLIRLLRGNGRTLQQLRAELGVTKRTVQRDIEVLEQTGFPVTSVQRKRSIYWQLAYDSLAGPLELTHEEMMALYFSRGLMKPLAGTPFFEAIESAIAKIGAGISPAGHSLLQGIDREIGVGGFGAKDYSRSRQVIAGLTRALQHHFTVKLMHATPQHKKALQYRVDPYRLRYHDGGLYLIGLDRAKEEMRTFAVERIRSVSVSRSRFTPPTDAILGGLESTAFQLIQGETQLVRIKFSASQSPYLLERKWHRSQSILRNGDGTVVLSMQVANLWEVKRWLLGWGANADVLEPLSLRKEIQAECQALISNSIGR